ncbi:MAG: MATE family efflux transporter, partial [Selenomonas sp.]|nr:MATE family efflux transporter [Selenomonas sp.]
MIQRYLWTQADRKYLQLAMPAAWEGVFMILLSSVDLIMVGVLGTAAIAAVSIFTQPRMMLLTVARSLASAVTVLTAEHFGGGRREQAAAIMRQSLGLGAFVLLGLH